MYQRTHFDQGLNRRARAFWLLAIAATTLIGVALYQLMN